MPKKPYKSTDEDTPITLNEPAFAYAVDEYGDTMVATVEPAVIERSRSAKPSVSSKFSNPNVPVECTQEEFVAHIRSIEANIEAGNFFTAEESERRFEQWTREFLASRI